MNLRTAVIKLAHEHPELRGDLLPLLKSASDSLLDPVLGMHTLMPLIDRLDDVDEQSRDLAVQVYQTLVRKYALPQGDAEALRRLQACAKNAKTWDPALLRNNIFKAAHALGLKLPSGMF